MGVTCLEFRGENFRGWLKNRKIRESFLPRKFPAIRGISSQTMSENSDMQREIPRLHAVLASKSKRIGELEHMLRETKEAANQEYDRLRAENERLTESFTAKLKEKERECERNKKLKKFKLESAQIYSVVTLCPPPTYIMIISFRRELIISDI